MLACRTLKSVYNNIYSQVWTQWGWGFLSSEISEQML
jgi:hypothetical protein